MELDVVRKDAPAAETIRRAHAILDSVGFPRSRAVVQRWTAGPCCHSCHLRFANYPLIFSNGKGVTADLAYASAVAEFLERLQCFAGVLFSRAGNIHQLPPFERERVRTLDEIRSSVPRLAASDLRGISPEGAGDPPCVPFVEVFSRRTVDLPYPLLAAMTGSSGMCAGNTPEEALTHGLCEAFERFAIRQLQSGAARGLPTIDAGSLRVRSRIVGDQLRRLRSAGIEVLVKDASLGGIFPVVAVVLEDRAAATCQVAFGSDPVFDIALSRCITEAFQGTDKLARPVTSRLAPSDTYNNLPVLLDQLRDDVGPALVEHAFADASSNAEALSTVLDRVRHLGRELFVHDFSVLGFPAYYVFVEGISPLYELRDATLSGLRREGDGVRRTLFGLAYATREDISRCADVLFAEVTGGSLRLERDIVASVLQAPVAACLDLRTLLALMLLEAGRVEQARAVVRWRPVGLERTASAEDVAGWIPSYAITRGSRASADDLRAHCAAAFGAETVAHASLPPAVGPLPVPRCETVYSCPSCACRRYCWLDEWYALAVRLRAKAVERRQQDVLEVLAPRV